MTPLASSAAHVDAYCSTGSSPGRSTRPTYRRGTVQATIRLDHHGIRTVAVPFEIQGPADAAPVVVLGGISANRHLCPSPEDTASGWWPGVVGPGQTLDPNRDLMVGIDFIGSGEWRPQAPLTTRDQARALEAVLEHLELDRVTVVGASYGGMVALALAVAAPARVRRTIVLCAAHRPHPMATAVRSIQRSVLRLGARAGLASEGVALARALAMTTYRSEAEFEDRFSHRAEDADSDDPRFPVDRYLEARGQAFSRRFDVETYVRLSESVDLHDLDPRTLTVPTTLLSVDSDVLAPAWLVEELAESAPGVQRHVRIRSRFGHDAFLKETTAVSRFLEAVLDDGEVRS